MNPLEKVMVTSIKSGRVGWGIPPTPPGRETWNFDLNIMIFSICKERKS